MGPGACKCCLQTNVWVCVCAGACQAAQKHDRKNPNNSLDVGKQVSASWLGELPSDMKGHKESTYRKSIYQIWGLHCGGIIKFPKVSDNTHSIPTRTVCDPQKQHKIWHIEIIKWSVTDTIIVSVRSHLSSVNRGMHRYTPNTPIPHPTAHLDTHFLLDFTNSWYLNWALIQCMDI